MHLLTSPDGLHWRSRLNGSGPLLDRSTFWYDSFRKKWIFSIKQDYKSPYGRSRGYVEADDFVAGANWSQADIAPWTSADASDPAWPYNDKLPAQLYTLDGTVYESLTVGLFSLFRGFVDENARTTGSRTSAEWDEIYVGFSRYDSSIDPQIQFARFSLHRDSRAGPLAIIYSVEPYRRPCRITIQDHIAFDTNIKVQQLILIPTARDGFHWWRQYDGNAQAGGATPRKVFMDQSWPLHSWRNSGVQSVGGGLNLGKINGAERLLFYASAQSGLPFDPIGTGGNSSMGVASLRRDPSSRFGSPETILEAHKKCVLMIPPIPMDFISWAQITFLGTRIVVAGRDGFTSVEAMMSGQPGTLTTRPIVWPASRHFFFVNAVIQAGGFMQVAVLDSVTNTTVPGFELEHSKVGSLDPSACVPGGSPAFDSTRAAVSWATGGGGAARSLAAVAGRSVRLQFELAAASLYSFWISQSTCGASGGVVGAGGPGTVGGRDMHGSCPEG
jgi:hypothetical protein